MDRNLLQIGGLIAIIIGIFYCFLIITIIIGLPLIIGGLMFTNFAKLDDEHILNEKNAILGWSIFFMIFGFLVPGILGLLFYFGMDNISKKEMHYIDELKELNKLKEEGVISKEEFNKKKKELLNKQKEQ